MGIGSALRMAGQKVRSFDDAYASKVAELINGYSPKANSMGDTAQNIGLFSAGIPATRKYDVGDIGNTMPGAQSLHGLMGYGVPALNAGVRYGLPAAGAVGLANGIDGLYNMAAQTPVFGNNPADVSDPNLMVSYVR